ATARSPSGCQLPVAAETPTAAPETRTAASPVAAPPPTSVGEVTPVMVERRGAAGGAIGHGPKSGLSAPPRSPAGLLASSRQEGADDGRSLAHWRAQEVRPDDRPGGGGHRRRARGDRRPARPERCRQDDGLRAAAGAGAPQRGPGRGAGGTAGLPPAPGRG